MVKTIAGLFRRSAHHYVVHVDSLSEEARALLNAAAERARQRLAETGQLEVERDAQREIRERVEAA